MHLIVLGVQSLFNRDCNNEFLQDAAPNVMRKDWFLHDRLEH